MSVALHISAGGFRSLRCEGQRLIARRCPAVYLDLPDTDIHRGLLERAGIPHATCSEALVVLGEAAIELSQTLHRPCLPLLPEGKLAEHDPVARQIANALVEAVLPACPVREQVCGVVLPGDPVTATSAGEPVLEFFSRVIRLCGYEPLVLQAGQALVLSELANEGFSGIGLYLGTTECSMCIARCGTPLVAWTLHRGTDAIDAEFARARDRVLWDSQGNRYLDTGSVARWRPTVSSLITPRSPDERLLSELYRHLIRDVLAHPIDTQAALRLQQITQPLNVACAFDGLPVNGLREIVAQELSQPTPLPIVRDVRLAANPHDAVVRGCLIYSELESSQQSRSA